MGTLGLTRNSAVFVAVEAVHVYRDLFFDSCSSATASTSLRVDDGDIERRLSSQSSDTSCHMDSSSALLFGICTSPLLYF